MNKYLAQLVKLSKIDNEIDEFEPKINKAKHSLEVLQEQESELIGKIDSAKEEKLKEELNNKKNELHIAELSDKLIEISKKSADVKTQKEAKALLLEEEIAREQIGFANEEIGRLEKAIENKMEELEELEIEINEVKEKITETSAVVNIAVEKLEDERTKVYEAKNELVAKIPQKIFEFYQKIKKWAKNTTVVPIKKQACYGCFLKIDNNNYAEIIKGDEIRNCPHCGRILYIEEIAEE